jgi:GntR family transcriptional repressor for pyruvate dehydrogenase complex
MFREIKQSRAFEEVVSQVQESILRGEFKPGDRLPSERKLGEIFKVSRGTLREAFRALEQKGLITVGTGVHGGAFVRLADNRPSSGK